MIAVVFDGSTSLWTLLVQPKCISHSVEPFDVCVRIHPAIPRGRNSIVEGLVHTKYAFVLRSIIDIAIHYTPFHLGSVMIVAPVASTISAWAASSSVGHFEFVDGSFDAGMFHSDDKIENDETNAVIPLLKHTAVYNLFYLNSLNRISKELTIF